MKKFIKNIFVVIVALFSLIVVSNGTVQAQDTVDVKIGLTGSDSKVWNYIKEEAAKEGINLELLYFDSYPLPNRALAEKEIDINAFQHHIYLEKEIEEFDYDITVIGETVFAPLAFYSEKITDLSEVKDGDIVAIPDDTTNGGRALKLLETHGFIEIDPAAELTPTINDITNYLVDIEIIELAATNIPATLPDVTFAAVNSGVASNAGFTVDQALEIEEATAGENPYINVIVVRTEDKDNEVYNRLVELYQTDEVKEIIAEESNGTSVPAWE
ncbi:MetQ/NlpA family ABC transporter substrate-binding protein [Fundicoccus culcitae]|uniref:Lipoprotein n=1 Tax=Fundicoccus culcitae TaxID=2969821 RepID=A0ABY5P6Y3_9LACT|nr:MetQ/NlpA family ABC transporter substrate-binding protein [Fundicoccus culcitae]UUX34494.1 MetQ/NlpA family ABC transporter substrate-binding protein [Fundicoccus culcitae]